MTGNTYCAADGGNALSLLPRSVAEILLADRSTGRNIIWATDEYSPLGRGYGATDEMTLESALAAGVPKPRTGKGRDRQTARTRGFAEVYTPAWVCGMQADLLDRALFGAAGPECAPDGDAYINAKILEAACGEAPYIAGRYDAATGEPVAVGSRAGHLDRKFSAAKARAGADSAAFHALAEAAVRSVYGYEWQGDSLLMARINVLLSYAEHCEAATGAPPDEDRLARIACIVSWNFWQMDGLKGVTPLSCHDEPAVVSEALFGFDDECHGSEREKIACRGCVAGGMANHNGTYCMIRPWDGRADAAERFADAGPCSRMRFDAVTGNPPYQVMDGDGTTDGSSPIYQMFFESAKSLAPRAISMIMPARWYSGGKGLDSFRERMLGDDRIAEIRDFSDASDCFAGVEIKGGVCILLWDASHSGPCTVRSYSGGSETSSSVRPLRDSRLGLGFFVRYNEAISILGKVEAAGEPTFDGLVGASKPFGIPTNFREYSHEPSACRPLRIYAQKDAGYVSETVPTRGFENIGKWKVLMPTAVGSGIIGSYDLKPIVAAPGSVCCETYVVIRPCGSREECENVASYMRTKFFRFLLGLRKITHHTSRKEYSLVPVQDFGRAWTDADLYAKYGLNSAEIAFIEKKCGNLK